MKNNRARRVSTVLATAVVAFTTMASAHVASTGTAAAADPVGSAALPVPVGSSASGGNADGAADGTVESPLIPPAAWDRAENVIGRISGKELGIAAMDRRECTPITAIHVPGSGETNEQRDPDVPHGRVVAGLGHDLTAEFGDDVRNLYLPYVSDAFLTTSYESSAAAGLGRFAELVAAVDAACPGTDFVFTGYSQGADILNAWVAGGASSLHPDRVKAMALFGKPRRGADVAVAHGTAPADSEGIFGPHEGSWGEFADRIFDSCNTGDLWCDSTPAMRRIGPSIMSASLNPKDAAGARNAAAAIVGPEGMADPETRTAVEALLRFLLSQSHDHIQYENELDGAPSARAEARQFLAEKLAR